MRTFITTTAFVLAGTFSSVEIHAQEDTLLRERIAARRDLAVAKSMLRHYWQVEYPRLRRELETSIELTEMEIKNLTTELREFRPFTQFSIGQPFPLTVRRLEMCLKAAELRLDNLRAERNALVRFRGIEFDALAANVAEARQVVLELEREDEADALPVPSPDNPL